MAEFDETRVQKAFDAVKDFAEATGAGKENPSRAQLQVRKTVNTDKIITALSHTPSMGLTAADVVEVRRRVDEWKASLPEYAA